MNDGGKIFLALLFLSLFFPTTAFAAVAISTDGSNNLSPFIGESFNVSASISGAGAGEIYFVKCRIGPDTSNLSEGQTYNPSALNWLNDIGSNSAWVDMPQVTVDGNGAWSGIIQCRVKTGVAGGTKIVVTRACLNSGGTCTTAFSSSNSITINAQEPTPTPTPTETPTPAPTSTPAPTATPTNTPTATPTKTPTPRPTVRPTLTSLPEVLGEGASPASDIADLRNQLKTPTPTPLVESSKKFPIFPVFLIVGGLACMSFAGLSLFRRPKSGYNEGNEENL